MHFLDRFVHTIVGCTNWKRNRVLTKELSQLFSISDKAFLLLCYNCYSEKWVADYNKHKLHQLIKPANSTNNSTNKEEEQKVEATVPSVVRTITWSKDSEKVGPMPWNYTSTDFNSI
jgi:hypothetical protein